MTALTIGSSVTDVSIGFSPSLVSVTSDIVGSNSVMVVPVVVQVSAPLITSPFNKVFLTSVQF